MRYSKLIIGFVSLAVMALLVSPAHGAPRSWPNPQPTAQEPTPNPGFRDLRTDAVKEWYIYNDRNLNGILDPGDQKIDVFKNWWTPVSAHSQHNYSNGPYATTTFPDGDDWPSGPQNHADLNIPSNNYWIEGAANTIKFYMTYSQYDNNDFTTFDAGMQPGDDKTLKQGRNMYRNGYAMGWLTHRVKWDPQTNTFINDQTPAGSVKMDVYVKDGQKTFNINGWGTSRSDPNITLSNDISYLAKDATENQWHPPTFDPLTGTYNKNTPVNQAYMAQYGLTDAQFDTIVASMEVGEVDAAGINPGDVIWGGRTPDQIANDPTLKDHAGNDYVYADAFLERSEYVESSSDGGVIAGLAGQTSYDPQINNWGDQQVIRIDISAETLASGDPDGNGNITTVQFLDFGYDPLTGQVNPMLIELDLTDTDLFPENRFYIAQVNMVPEPATMIFVVAAGIPVLLKRRRKAKA